MPEEKPWEQYKTANQTDGGGSKPWEAYSASEGDNLMNVGSDEFDPDKLAMSFNKQDSQQLENTLNDIVKTSRPETVINDWDKDILRDVLKNPNTTPEQAREAIQTIQGYHPKYKDNGAETTKYYVKKDDNGVLVPRALAYGERPPEGYNVASVWGNQKDSNDDAWYTDFTKSLVNGLVGGAKGVAAVGQMGYNLVTDKDSEFLNEMANSAERLQFNKDEALNQQIYNTEGVEKFSDLASKDRFDFSGKALWGTLNSVVESVVPFMMGSGAASGVAKGLSKTGELSKAAQYGSAVAGSFLTMIPDNLDHAKEAGLTGRDAASVAGLTTLVQSSIEGLFGLESDVFRKMLGKKESSAVLGRLIAGVEKDAEGKLTEQGFKQLAKELTTTYSSIAKSAGKEFVKDVAKEGVTEGAQDFVAKAGEQLWDKLSDEDKAKFGTDATSAKSFGSYIQNMVAGVVGGVPMGAASAVLDKKKQQTETAMSIVEGGQDKMNEFKANAYAAARNGDITTQQRDEAIFKVDQFNKYWEQTKDLKMDTEQRKKAFELSFNIEGLKNEIPKDTEGLDPIAIAKIDTKKELVKGLQNDLNSLLLRQEIAKEPVVGESTIKKVAKDVEQEGGFKQPKMSLDEILKKIRPTQDTEMELDSEGNIVNTRRKNNPKFDAQTPSGAFVYNQLPALERKEVLHDYFKENPQLNNELTGYIHQGQNNKWYVDLGGKRFMQFAKSIEPDTFVGEVHNFPDVKEDVQDSDGQPLVKYTEPIGVRLETIKSNQTKGGYKKVVNIYNKKTGKHIIFGKETEKGTTTLSPMELEQIKEIQGRDNSTAFDPGEITPNKDVQFNPKPSYFKAKPKNYMAMVEKAKNESTLDEILDKATAEDAASPELIDAISKRRPLVKPKKAAETPLSRQRLREIKESTKPKVSLNFITDSETLNKTLETDTADGKKEVSVKKLQGEIIKKLYNLEKLLNCIHG